MRVHPFVRVGFRALALVALAVVAHAGGVRIVDQPALGSFSTIQAAVDAASEGDVLLVGGGNYAGFVIDGKSLSLFGWPGSNVQISSVVEVKNLAGPQTVLISRMTIKGATQLSQSQPGLKLTANSGRVRFQECTLEGGAGSIPYQPQYHHGAAGDGAVISSSTKVAFSGCILRGGKGGFTPFLDGDYESEGGNGGDGVDATNSSVVLYSCQLLGGEGGDAGADGGEGGSGYRAQDLGVVAVGCQFTGAEGGMAWDWLASGYPGAGGNGLFAGTGTQAQLRDNTFAFGSGGECFTDPDGGACFGPDGQSIAGGGVFNTHSGSAGTLTGPTILPDDAEWTLSGTGLPGERVLLALSSVPSFNVPSPVSGIWLVPPPAKLLWPPKAIIGAPGTFTFTQPAQPIAGADDARVLYGQGLFAASGTRLLGDAVHLLSLRRQALPDCDGDGVSDFVAILEGLVLDCNQNLVPDDCDVASGSSTDFDFNGVPDECDPFLYVDPLAAPGGDGAPTRPFQTIRQAYTAAVTDDTIVLLDGTYTGPDNRDLTLLKKLTVQSAHGAAACILDLQATRRAFMTRKQGTVIEGITFKNGKSGTGGGVYVFGEEATVRNCVFQQCSASNGGALAIEHTSALVEGCTFVLNSTNNPLDGNGGAVYVRNQGEVARFVDCRFAQNLCRRGGAIALQSTGSVVASHCTFLANTATIGGGSVHASQDSFSSPTIVGFDHCQFAGNQAPNGGVLMLDGSAAVALDLALTNSTLVANSASTDGGAVWATDLSTSTLRNCVVWSNSAPTGKQIVLAHADSDLSLSYCDVQGGLGSVSAAGGIVDYGPGAIDLDPLFADVDGADGNLLTFGDNDYRLLAGSPCIDAGDNLEVLADLFDVDGDANTSELVPLDLDFLARFADDPLVADTGNGSPPIVDMGPYERRP